MAVTSCLCGKIWLTFSVASGLLGFLSGWCFNAIWNKQTTETKTVLSIKYKQHFTRKRFKSVISCPPISLNWSSSKLTLTIKRTKLWTTKIYLEYCYCAPYKPITSKIFRLQKPLKQMHSMGQGTSLFYFNYWLSHIIKCLTNCPCCDWSVRVH